jgi:hypothetical protein
MGSDFDYSRTLPGLIGLAWVYLLGRHFFFLRCGR